MKEKTATKEHTGSYDPSKTVTDLFAQATKSYEYAIQNALKLQEEATKCAAAAFSQTSSITELQKKFTELTKAATGFLPISKKQMTELFDLADKNSRAGTELLTRAVEASKAQTLGESTTKWVDLWTASLAVARTNAETLNKAATEAIDSCLESLRKNSEVFGTAKAA